MTSPRATHTGQAAARGFQLLKATLCGLLALALTGCETDDYEAGQGELSAMRADFADAYTDGDSHLASAMTDDGDSLRLTPPMAVRWMETPDSCFRTLLYYKKVEGRTEGVAAHSVVCPTVLSGAEAKDKKQDPVRFESAWLGRNRRYLNLGLYVMAGEADNSQRQQMGVACDTVTVHKNGTRTLRLRLLHNQNGMPEYFSVQTFVSIPLQREPLQARKGDTIEVSIRTYDGDVKKTLPF